MERISKVVGWGWSTRRYIHRSKMEEEEEKEEEEEEEEQNMSYRLQKGAFKS